MNTYVQISKKLKGWPVSHWLSKLILSCITTSKWHQGNRLTNVVMAPPRIHRRFQNSPRLVGQRGTPKKNNISCKQILMSYSCIICFYKVGGLVGYETKKIWIAWWMDGMNEWFKIWLISKRSWEWRGGNLSSLHLDHINSHRPVAENPRKVGCREGVDTGKKPMKTTRMIFTLDFNMRHIYI